METPNYFPQCKKCILYDISLDTNRTYVGGIRAEIADKVEHMVQRGHKEFDDKYAKCKECFQSRLDEAEGKKPKTEKEPLKPMKIKPVNRLEKRINGDREFLISIKIKPESILN